MPSGSCSLHSFRLPSQVAAQPSMTAASWSTPWPTGCGPAALAAAAHDLPPGRPSTTSSAAGDSKGCRSKSTIGWMSWNAAGKGGRARPAQPSSTARASRPPSWGPHGYDGAKRRTGRKRHLLVDTLDPICKVPVTAADVGDRDGAMALRRRLDRRRGGSPGCGTAGSMVATAALPGLGPPAPQHQLSGGVAQRRRAQAALAAARGDPAGVPVRGGSPPLGGGADLRLAGSLPSLE
jgi:hypothetical protein